MPSRISGEGAGREVPASALCVCFFFQAEGGIRDLTVTGVQTCALPIYTGRRVRSDLCHRRELHQTCALLAGHYDSRRAVIDTGRVACAYGAFLLKGGLQQIGRASCRERV